ncbi:hypothetical protein GGX14DRAFT_391878 [Mycena pura]|uniref:Uncharacterized protein n=1 Tax=Mycena pura TaxID=153505 RepID=A0AAD6VNI9_9AGAR|nr:hypothetical protein GGX14DRAFT_391878 [Mycena pura]
MPAPLPEVCLRHPSLRVSPAGPGSSIARLTATLLLGEQSDLNKDWTRQELTDVREFLARPVTTLAPPAAAFAAASRGCALSTAFCSPRLCPSTSCSPAKHLHGGFMPSKAISRCRRVSHNDCYLGTVPGQSSSGEVDTNKQLVEQYMTGQMICMQVVACSVLLTAAYLSHCSLKCDDAAPADESPSTSTETVLKISGQSGSASGPSPARARLWAARARRRAGPGLYQGSGPGLSFRKPGP